MCIWIETVIGSMEKINQVKVGFLHTSMSFFQRRVYLTAFKSDVLKAGLYTSVFQPRSHGAQMVHQLFTGSTDNVIISSILVRPNHQQLDKV